MAKVIKKIIGIEFQGNEVSLFEMTGGWKIFIKDARSKTESEEFYWEQLGLTLEDALEVFHARTDKLQKEAKRD